VRGEVGASKFVLGIGGRLYGISASRAARGAAARPAARFSAAALGPGRDAGDIGRTGGPVVRLERGDGSSLVQGGVDFDGAEALLSDASFWSSLGEGDADRLAGISERIAAELAEGRPGSRALAGAYALELVILAARLGEGRLGEGLSAASRPWSPPDGVWSVDDAARYIEANYTEVFSLDWFVSKCAMNVSDFSRRFRERAGCPLFEFINRKRVERACALLKSSDMPIIEIAAAVGYNSLSFFNRYFLRIAGVSPRAFRSGSSR